MKRLLLVFIAISIIASTYAQAPAGFSYQAVARNAQGQLITNTLVTFQIAILKGGIDGISVYAESFSPTTNNFGLVNLSIGNGTVLSGTFTDIDWGTDTYFIKVWLNSIEMGTTQLLSVPYALHAKTAEGIAGGINETDPIFTAWDKNSGIQIYESQISDLQAYTVEEIDPLYRASVASTITLEKIDYWNNKLETFLERDPTFFLWDKSTGISITSDQVNDFQTSVSNNPEVIANTAKISYPIADAAKLAAITGTNTGDQDLSGKVDKIEGKGLSSNDYTPEEKAKLAAISGTNTGDQDLSAMSHTNRIALDAVSGVNTGDQDLSGKVDKVVDKGLSTNDYTTAEKTKLEGVAIGAEVNVNADWNSLEGDAQILNKPVLSTVATTGNFSDLSGIPASIYFIPKVSYFVGNMNSPITIDISNNLPAGVKALLCTVEFRNQWIIDYYGGSFLEVYYGNQTETEKIRIESPIEDTNSINYYTQTGQTSVLMIIPVIDGNKIALKHQGLNYLNINGYFK